MTRNLKISLILSVLLIGFIRLRPIWERMLGDFFILFYFLCNSILLVWLIVKIIKEVIWLSKQRNNLNYKIFIPTLIMTMALLDGLFNPFRIDLDFIYGEVNIQAYSEYGPGQEILKIRDNGKFDLQSTGVFFYNRWYLGKYKKNGDTIALNFDGNSPRNFCDSLVVRGEKIYEIENDSLINSSFILETTKGLNGGKKRPIISKSSCGAAQHEDVLHEIPAIQKLN